jgi:hypothetical protein
MSVVPEFGLVQVTVCGTLPLVGVQDGEEACPLDVYGYAPASHAPLEAAVRHPVPHEPPAPKV